MRVASAIRAAPVAATLGVYVLGVPQLYGKVDHYHHVIALAVLLAGEVGGHVDDDLHGDAGQDLLVGGLGNDTLTGNAGADRFVFNAPLGSGNVDTITDFGNGADKLVLSALMFEGLTAGGTVNLVVDGAATTADPTVLYDSTTGMLSYDADGNGAGPAVDFAKLQSLAPLTSSDFMII